MPKRSKNEPEDREPVKTEPSQTTEDPKDFDEHDPEEHEDEEGSGRFARFTRRLLEREDGRKVLSAMWETSDRAKTEAVRMVAREVRSYLDALELKEDLLDLVRSHSLEVTASLRLKPLAPTPKGDDDSGSR